MASAAEVVATAAELADAKPAEAVALLRSVCLAPGSPGDAELKAREAAVGALCALLAKQRDAAALCALLSELRPLFAVIPKAKTAKLVRTVIDAVATVPDTAALQARCRGPPCRESRQPPPPSSPPISPPRRAHASPPPRPPGGAVQGAGRVV